MFFLDFANFCYCYFVYFCYFCKKKESLKRTQIRKKNVNLSRNSSLNGSDGRMLFSEQVILELYFFLSTTSSHQATRASSSLFVLQIRARPLFPLVVEEMTNKWTSLALCSPVVALATLAYHLISVSDNQKSIFLSSIKNPTTKIISHIELHFFLQILNFTKENNLFYPASRNKYLQIA